MNKKTNIEILYLRGWNTSKPSQEWSVNKSYFRCKINNKHINILRYKKRTKTFGRQCGLLGNSWPNQLTLCWDNFGVWSKLQSEKCSTLDCPIKQLKCLIKFLS